jgi:hypothetical protein
MAVVIPEILTELEAIFTGGGLIGGIERGLGGLLGGFAVSDILNYLNGNPSGKKKVPHFALVDLKNDKVLVFVSRRRAYRFLLRPRRPATRTKVIREIVHDATRTY